MVCTFFGHRDCTELDKNRVYEAIEKAINEDVDVFLVGHQGRFDRMVYACLKQLRISYPQIQVGVVFSRLPEKKDENWETGDTIFPEAVENGPPKFAIHRRNRWMLQQADAVVCYVRVPWGGAYKFAALAYKKGKQVINLCPEGVDFDKSSI